MAPFLDFPVLMRIIRFSSRDKDMRVLRFVERIKTKNSALQFSPGFHKNFMPE